MKIKRERKGLVFIALIMIILCVLITVIGLSLKQNTVEENYEYSKYGTIILLHKDTGAIETVNLDEYLYNKKRNAENACKTISEIRCCRGYGA